MHNDLRIMHFKVSVLLTIICCLFVGCTSVPDELFNAERLMDTNPDSALFILQHLKPEKYNAKSSHALYGLLLYHALEKTDKNIQPDSLIDFSINYYLNQNDNLHTASCYFYKGHMLKHAQHYDEAAVLYLKALDCLQDKKDFELLGELYRDLGDISSFQRNFKESSKKYRVALDFFNRAGKTSEANYTILSIGRTYMFLKNFKTALKYYNCVLKKKTDSLLTGSTYQEIGINYYSSKQYDSAQFYLRISLDYPYRGNNYAIRCICLAEVLFDIDQFDSSYQYATKALKYPVNFYNQRDCYRLLTNIEFTKNEIKQTRIYLNHYQDYNDSIRKVESQSKITILEKLHNTTQEANGSKRNMFLIVSLLFIVLLLSGLIVFYLYKRDKLKRKQLETFKHQLNTKQEFVSQSLIHKIEETKALQADSRKYATVDDKEKLDKELYYNALHLNNWDDFNREMNHAFNNIIITLTSGYPTVNQKEITWCCLHLLDIPHADRMLVLEATSDSLYKLKQRLAHKFNLKTTKELDLFLKNLTAISD